MNGCSVTGWLNGFAGLYGFIAAAAQAGQLSQLRRRRRQDGDSPASPRDRSGLYSPSLKRNGDIPMSNQNRLTAIADSHSEIATRAFQIFTIAVMGAFSVWAVLHTAAQII